MENLSRFYFPNPTFDTLRIETEDGDQVDFQNNSYRWNFATLAENLDSNEVGRLSVFYSIRDAMVAFFGGDSVRFLNNPTQNIMATVVQLVSVGARFLVCRPLSETSFEVFITDGLNNDPSLIQKTIDIQSYTFRVNDGGQPNIPLPKYSVSLNNGILTIGNLEYAPTLDWNLKFSTAGRSILQAASYFDFLDFEGVIKTSPTLYFDGFYNILEIQGKCKGQLSSTGQVIDVHILGNTILSNFASSMRMDVKNGIISGIGALSTGIVFEISPNEFIIGQLFIDAFSDTQGNKVTNRLLFRFLDPSPDLFQLYSFANNPKYAGEYFYLPTGLVYHPSIFIFQKQIMTLGKTQQQQQTSIKIDIQVYFIMDENENYSLLGLDGDIQLDSNSVNWSLINYGSIGYFPSSQISDGQYTLNISLRSLPSNAAVGTIQMIRRGPSVAIDLLIETNKGIINRNPLTIHQFNESELQNVSIDSNPPRGEGGEIAVFGGPIILPTPANSNGISESFFLGFSIAFLILLVVVLALLTTLLIRQRR